MEIDADNLGLDNINVDGNIDKEFDRGECNKDICVDKEANHFSDENKHIIYIDDLGGLGELGELEKLHDSVGATQEDHYANCSIEEFQQKYMLQNSPVISYANTPNGSRLGSRQASRNNSCNNSDSEDIYGSVRKNNPSSHAYDYRYEVSAKITENVGVSLIRGMPKDISYSNELVPHSELSLAHQPPPKYEKLTVADVEKSLSKYYVVGDNYSDEFTLLVTWLAGNISMLEYSRKLKTVKLWLMVIFSASISTSIAFIVPFTHHDQFWNLVYICGSSALNVIIVIVLLWSRIGYNIKSFETAITQYELVRNILNPVEIGENGRNMPLIRDKIETQVNNIHTHFSYVIPSEVSNMYPVLAYTNIFDLIKKIGLYRKNLVVKLRDIKNEIRLIVYKWSMNGSIEFIVSIDETKLTSRELKEKKRYLFLLGAKEDTRNELLQMRNTYVELNNLFIEEIKYAKAHKLFYTLSTFVYKKPTPEITIPVLKDYLRLIQ
jgi:hypothetical protein